MARKHHTDTHLKLIAALGRYKIPTKSEWPIFGDMTLEAIADILVGTHLVVEVDGPVHHLKYRRGVKDERRDAKLKEMGYTVLRFSNDSIKRDLDGVVKEILDAYDRLQVLR